MAEVVGFLILVFIIGPIVIDVVFGLGMLPFLMIDRGPKKKKPAEPIATTGPNEPTNS